MIQLKQLNKFYSNKNGLIHALRDINLSVEPGTVHGIIGKSGAGKSSLLRCVNLLERPSSGTVTVDGVELTQLKEVDLRRTRKQIGMIFQHFNLLNTKTVFDNVALPLYLAKQKRDVSTEKKVLALLELVGLKEYPDYYPEQLSGGQKQRVAIARALITYPKVLLCDEATSSLDPQTTTALLSLLKDINQEFSITILLITHEMDVIKQICHCVSIMDRGTIFEEGCVETIFSNPKTEIAKDLIHAAATQNLPPHLKDKLSQTPFKDCHPILKIIFHNDSSASPIISLLIRQFDLTINIHAANIEYIVDKPLGIMIVEIVDKNNQALPAAIDFLQAKQVSVEVLGYVR